MRGDEVDGGHAPQVGVPAAPTAEQRAGYIFEQGPGVLPFPWKPVVEVPRVRFGHALWQSQGERAAQEGGAVQRVGEAAGVETLGGASRQVRKGGRRVHMHLTT